MAAEAEDIKQLCQMTESETGEDGQKEPLGCISGVLWHRRVYMGVGGGGVRCMWEKKNKKDRVQEERRRRQAGKMECGIENVSEELEAVRWEIEVEKEKQETDVTEDRGKNRGVKVKYNKIAGSREMLVTDMAHAWIPSALSHCQLLNEGQHSDAETSVPSRFISPAGFLFFHLTPPADAAHHLSPRPLLIINQTALWSLPPSLPSMAVCSWLQILWSRIFCDSNWVAFWEYWGTASLLSPPSLYWFSCLCLLSKSSVSSHN